MKTLFTLILAASSLALAAQDSLTIGEIFDFEVGDEFHYTDSLLRPNTLADPEWKIIRRVLDKAYPLPDSSEVVYTIEHRHLLGGCDYRIDTVVESYSSLDSLLSDVWIVGTYLPFFMQSQGIGDCNGEWHVDNPTTFHSTSTEYNQRPFSVWYDEHFGCCAVLRHLAKGLGWVYSHSMNIGGCIGNLNMVYFQKGTETWGTPLTITPVHTPELMTRGEVYDYDIGDVFQWYRQPGYSPLGHFYEHTVVDKQSYGTDSVAYTMAIRDSSEIDHSVHTRTEVLVYTDLHASIFTDTCASWVGNWSNCQPQRLVNFHQTKYAADILKETAVKGCGVYRRVNVTHISSIQNAYKEELRYFYKAATADSCGQRVLMPPLIPEEELDPEHFTAYWNPLSRSLQLAFPPDPHERQLHISNMMGMVVYQTTIPAHTTQLELATLQLPRGVFVAFLTHEGNKKPRAQVKWVVQ